MPKCIECNKSATYGTVYKKPIHCVSHKKINEINVKHKRCENKSCIKKASYGIEGTVAIHCKEHKTIMK
jgi:predicted transcriptional regulator